MKRQKIILKNTILHENILPKQPQTAQAQAFSATGRQDMGSTVEYGTGQNKCNGVL